MHRLKVGACVYAHMQNPLVAVLCIDMFVFSESAAGGFLLLRKI